MLVGLLCGAVQPFLFVELPVLGNSTLQKEEVGALVTLVGIFFVFGTGMCRKSHTPSDPGPLTVSK